MARKSKVTNPVEGEAVETEAIDEEEETEQGGDAVGGIEGLDDFEAVNHVLDVCGVSDKNEVRVAFTQVEGLSTLVSFGLLEGDKDVKDMCARMAGRTQKNGQVIIGTIQMKCLQALVYWVRDLVKHNQVIDHNYWTKETMNIAMEEKEMERSFKDVKIDIIDPGKCKTGLEWDDWQTAFENKLESTYGVGNMPLAYIIRPRVGRDHVFHSKADRNKYMLSLNGPTFDRNNKMVYAAIKAACLNTEAWAWIEDADEEQDGRLAWKRLIEHYNGTAELSKRVERAKEELRQLFYKNEASFSFDSYVTKLKRIFSTLNKDDDEQLSEKQMVDALREGIKSNDGNIIAAKVTMFQQYRYDFDKAQSFMSGLISTIHSAAVHEHSHRGYKRRNVSAMESGGRGRGRARMGGRGDRGGRACGRGRGGGSDLVCAGARNTGMANGVDISDWTRSFSPQEWDQMGPVGRRIVSQERERINGGRFSGRARGRGGQGRGRSVSAVNYSSQVSTVPASTITHENSNNENNSGNGERGAQNGAGFGRGAYGGRGGGRN